MFEKGSHIADSKEKSSLETRLKSRYLPLKAKHDAWKAGKGESPTIEEYKEISSLARQLLDFKKGRVPLVNESEAHDLHDLVQELAKTLQDNLNARHAGGKNPITIEIPKLPENLTRAHLEAVKEALGHGKGFAERILPSIKSLNDLDKAYEDAMYPETQSEEDTKNGLISYRPVWWKDKVELHGFNFNPNTTWCGACLASMRIELEAMGNSLVLLDTAIKCKYTNGTQQYGTKEGTDLDQDPLLPLFKEAFGETATRFRHSWDDIEAKLLPLAKTKIQKAFKAKDLPNIDFDVILVPATLNNLEMTFHNPVSSSTDTWEWTSTILHDDEKKDTGRRLSFGHSGLGGAGRVEDVHRSNSNGYLGARLAVVFSGRH